MATTTAQMVCTHIDATTTNCEISQNNILPTFTYGEILINYWLFIIVIGCIFGFLINKFILKK